MVAFGPSMLCADAERYYYDYLCGLDAGIPQAVAEHIRYCVHCRTQIRQLEAAVAESEAQDRRPQGGTDVLGALNLHFAHIGEDVTCAKAKSFLPALLVPSLTIRIPTPITVHIDHCHGCAGNLKSIRELELRPKQLARLSRLYAATIGDDPHMCRRARAKTWAFACASFEGIDAEVLDHMCVCPRCRRRVYRCRQKILAGRQPGDTIPGVGLCSGLSMADLFEWVVPFGRSGGSPEQSPDEVVPSHLRACPECIERVQTLHRTIYGVAERVDSGVSTVYTAVGGARKRDQPAESPYSKYPIRVEVAYGKPEAVPTPLGPFARARELLRRRVADPQFRPVMKVVLAAAAVIPLAMALFINIRPASGVNADELDRAVKHVDNVYVQSFGQDPTKPTQEVWMAGGWMIVKDGRQGSLYYYDIKRREQKAIYPGDGTVETLRLTPDEWGGVQDGINRVVRFVQTGILDGRESQPLSRVPASDVQDGNDVYELTWPNSSNGDLLLVYRLRVSIDSTTGLPTKAVYSRKMPDEVQWRTYTTTLYKYPSRNDMDLAKENFFGRR